MERIRLIHDAAAMLFIRQGYSKTQISHIAEAIETSVGTIYHDFKGKNEIKNFILKCAIDDSFMNRSLERPIAESMFQHLETEILESFHAISARFASHLEDRGEHYSFEELISDAFDLLSSHATGCLFIERNQADSGRLTEYYKDYRKRFFHTMAEYLSIFVERNEIRPLPHLELTATMIIEILTWWAMDSRYSSFEIIEVSPEAAKELCMDNIITAYKR